MAVDISSTIGRVKLSSPIILGSFDPMVDARVLSQCYRLCGDSLGAVVTKSTTIEPRFGYPEPRVSAFGDGLLIASGNPNPGIRKMSEEIRTFKQHSGQALVFGSIVSDPDIPHRDLGDEYCFLAMEYAKAGADGVELNLSCPHLNPDDRELTIVPAQDEKTVHRLISVVKTSLAEAGYQNCLVIPKLTGWNCNPSKIAIAAEQAGADAVTISNLFPGTGYYTGLRDSKPGESRQMGSYLVAHQKGGYSGKAMHAAVLLMIETLRKHISIPVIATGGCASDLDSLVQTFMAGAIAVEAVTPFYFRGLNGMDSLLKVNELVGQLECYLDKHGMESPEALYRLRTSHG